MSTKPEERDIVELLDQLANSDGINTDCANALAAAADEIRGLREENRHLRNESMSGHDHD